MQNIDTEKIVLLREFFENVSDILISKYIFCVYFDPYGGIFILPFRIFILILDFQNSYKLFDL